LTPLAVTVYILLSGFTFLDNFLGGVVARLVGRHIPGAGAVLTIALTIVVGMIATNVVGRRLIAFGEALLKKIPVVSAVYSSVKQLFDAFAAQNRSGFKRVVLAEFPRKGLWSVGFLTSQSSGFVHERIDPESVTIFIPTAPNPTTGFMLIVPPDDLIYLDISVEAAFKAIISGGIVNPGNGGEANARKSV